MKTMHLVIIIFSFLLFTGCGTLPFCGDDVCEGNEIKNCHSDCQIMDADYCSLENGLNCLDFSADLENVKFSIVNAKSSVIGISQVYSSFCGTIYSEREDGTLKLSPGEKVNLSISRLNCNFGNYYDRFRSDIQIAYTDKDKSDSINGSIDVLIK